MGPSDAVGTALSALRVLTPSVLPAAPTLHVLRHPHAHTQPVNDEAGLPPQVSKSDVFTRCALAMKSGLLPPASFQASWREGTAEDRALSSQADSLNAKAV